MLDDDEPSTALPYDDEEAFLMEDRDRDAAATGPSLATRITGAKVYLLSESSLCKGRGGVGVEDVEDADEMEEDVNHRSNALLLRGAPISHLPTARLFEYATYFDTVPLGLEWVDDTSCVLVFGSGAAARYAHERLCATVDEPPDADGLLEAHAVPLSVWPAATRAETSDKIGGGIRLRWATVDDVKKRGAKDSSEFYRKHGAHAGKEVYRDGQLLVPVADASPRRRDRERNGHRDDHERTGRRDGRNSDVMRARLDAELDSFLADDGTGGRPQRLRDSRSSSPQPRRDHGRGGGRERRDGRGRPVKSQQDLDDELEAFLRER